MKPIFLLRSISTFIILVLLLNILHAQNFHLVKDINTSTNSYPHSYFNFISQSPFTFPVLNGISYFVADDGVHGAELFRSDGSKDGTYIVKDLFAGPASSNPVNITIAGSNIFFITNDSAKNDGSKNLWVSDGTASGTRLVKKFSYLYQSMALGNSLYFINNSTQLWKSDGTEQGTVMLFDFSKPPFNGDAIGSIYIVNGRIFFTGSSHNFNNNQYVLWVTDGTVNGTVVISESATQPDQLMPGPGNLIYFSANQSVSNSKRVLWVTTGNPLETTRIASANTNYDITRFQPFIIQNNTLFFLTSDTSTANNFTATNLYKYNFLSGDSATLVKKFIEPGPHNFIEYITAVNGNIYLSVYAQQPGGAITGQLWKTDGTTSGCLLLKDS